MPTITFPCVTDEGRDASAADVSMQFPICISDEAQEASHASGTWVSSCVCIH
jgi:hypothetical protein